MFQEQLKRPKNRQEQPLQNKSQEPFRWNRFQEWYDKKKQHSNQSQVLTSVQTPVGTVKKISLKDPIPEGWRKLTKDQAQKNLGQIVQLMQRWSIVALQTGAIDGHGYGCKFRQNCGEECGQLFIIKPKQN